MAISLLVHLAVILALLVTFRRHGVPELLPPPSPVAMVFESGHPSGPTVPHPSEQATPNQPVAPAQPEETPPTEEKTPPPPPPPAQPATPPKPATPPPPEAKPAPPPPAAPPVPSPPVPPPKPVPNEPTTVPLPPPPSPPHETPTQPPQVTIPPEQVMPTPPVPPPLTVPPLPAPPPPPPKAVARPRPPPSAFPPPMNYSFGSPTQPLERQPREQPSSKRRPPGAIDLSLGPAAKGQLDMTPLGRHASDAAVADWSNLLHQWVVERMYYPQEAIRQLQEGDSTVHVVMQPNGKVTSVELIGRSGSVWLDMALLALFRDQHLPPLPPGETGPFDFDFTVHYILRRTP